MRLGMRPDCAAQGYGGRCSGCRVRVGSDSDGTLVATVGDCMRLRLRLLPSKFGAMGLRKTELHEAEGTESAMSCEW